MRAATLVGSLALLAAIAAALYLTFGSTYDGVTCTATPEQHCLGESNTLVQENGSWILVLLAIPVLPSGVIFVSVLPGVSWDKYAGRTAAVGLLLFCVALTLSLGFFFLPALLLSIVALVLDRKREVAVR